MLLDACPVKICPNGLKDDADLIAGNERFKISIDQKFTTYFSVHFEASNSPRLCKVTRVPILYAKRINYVKLLFRLRSQVFDWLGVVCMRKKLLLRQKFFVFGKQNIQNQIRPSRSAVQIHNDLTFMRRKHATLETNEILFPIELITAAESPRTKNLCTESQLLFSRVENVTNHRSHSAQNIHNEWLFRSGKCWHYY